MSTSKDDINSWVPPRDPLVIPDNLEIAGLGGKNYSVEDDNLYVMSVTGGNQQSSDGSSSSSSYSSAGSSPSPTLPQDNTAQHVVVSFDEEVDSNLYDVVARDETIEGEVGTYEGESPIPPPPSFPPSDIQPPGTSHGQEDYEDTVNMAAPILDILQPLPSPIRGLSPRPPSPPHDSPPSSVPLVSDLPLPLEMPPPPPDFPPPPEVPPPPDFPPPPEVPPPPPDFPPPPELLSPHSNLPLSPDIGVSDSDTIGLLSNLPTLPPPPSSVSLSSVEDTPIPAIPPRPPRSSSPPSSPPVPPPQSSEEHSSIQSPDEVYEELHNEDTQDLLYEELPEQTNEPTMYEDMSGDLVNQYRAAQAQMQASRQPEPQTRRQSEPQTGGQSESRPQPQPQPRVRRQPRQDGTEPNDERRMSREPSVTILPSGNVVMMVAQPVQSSSTTQPTPPSYDDLSTSRPQTNPRPSTTSSNVTSTTVLTINQRQERSGSGGSNNSTLPDQNDGGVALTGFAQQGFSEEAPPSYNDLFSVTAPAVPPGTQQHPQQQQSRQMRVSSDNSRQQPQRQSQRQSQQYPQQQQQQQHPHRVPQPQPVLRQDSSTSTGCWCTTYTGNNPALTGIYAFLFIIGFLVIAGLLGLGVITYLSSSGETSDTGRCGSQPGICMLAMGTSCFIFFVWHVIALLIGMYMKAKDRHSKAFVSWMMRACHCGFFIWVGVLAIVSFLIWNEFNSILGLSITYYVMLGFVGCQYLMFLYCVIECCVDIFLCLDDNAS